MHLKIVKYVCMQICTYNGQNMHLKRTKYAFINSKTSTTNTKTVFLIGKNFGK